MNLRRRHQIRVMLGPGYHHLQRTAGREGRNPKRQFSNHNHRIVPRLKRAPALRASFPRRQANYHRAIQVCQEFLECVDRVNVSSAPAAVGAPLAMVASGSTAEDVVEATANWIVL